jgi:hypothetical protein
MLWLDLFRKPSKKMVLARQIQESEIELLNAELAREYYLAQCGMFKARLNRLRDDLHCSTAEDPVKLEIVK